MKKILMILAIGFSLFLLSCELEEVRGIEENIPLKTEIRTYQEILSQEISPGIEPEYAFPISYQY